MTSNAEEIKSMLEDIEAHESKLSEWEIEFVDSITSQLGAGKTLTLKQDGVLTRIWERITA